MTTLIQLDFFKSFHECEIDTLRHQVQSLKESNERVRKGLFARNGELTKQLIDISERLQIIEKNICKG